MLRMYSTVNGRHAAEDGMAEIERRGGGAGGGIDLDGLVVRIGNDAEAVDAVEFAGLRGNVRGREAEIQIRGQTVGTIFSDDSAVPVFIELIDERAVEARDFADLDGGQVHGLLDCAGILEGGEEVPDQRLKLAEREVVRYVGALEFEDDEVARAMDEGLVAAFVIDGAKAAKVDGPGDCGRCGRRRGQALARSEAEMRGARPGVFRRARRRVRAHCDWPEL